MGLERFREAVEKGRAVTIFEQTLPSGHHVVNVMLEDMVGNIFMEQKGLQIAVDSEMLEDYTLNFIESTIGHELFHINDFLRSKPLNESGAYRWQKRTALQFELNERELLRIITQLQLNFLRQGK